MTSSTDRGLSVLHVDDDPSMGSLVTTYLERDASGLDCTVTTETSPSDALARLREGDETFDCVVSDYNMPGVNGVEFLEAVREFDPELPLLLFSGEEPADIAAEIVAAGLTDYLRKAGDNQYTMLVRRVGHAVEDGVDDGQFDTGESDTELGSVAVVGRDESFERVDEQYADYYQYDSEDIAGKHWSELHPEEEVEHIRTHVLPVVQKGGEWRGRSEGLRADGSTFTESKLVSALDGGRLLIAVSELGDADDVSDDATGDRAA
ncbi:response regulator [Halobacterium jilantaiense]|uniref:PAS fold-containing protein n=1 Tax=Halobacterium jilantaiense TaxID=355548 RepID=A0A1I0NCC6_9EURY|nr:response regulator [Halobacterium jilantaiense]SEV98872.1 PAS fold-containing protein [Halobacterium jilantaiense]